MSIKVTKKENRSRKDAKTQSYGEKVFLVNPGALVPWWQKYQEYLHVHKTINALKSLIDPALIFIYFCHK